MAAPANWCGPKASPSRMMAEATETSGSMFIRTAERTGPMRATAAYISVTPRVKKSMVPAKPTQPMPPSGHAERKSVGEGKGGAGRVDLGGGRRVKKKHK